MPVIQPHPATEGGGSVLYRLSPDHTAAVLALVLFIGALWLMRHRLPVLAPVDALLAALAAASAAVHLGLAIGHTDHGAGLRLLFLLDAAALAAVARSVLRGAGAGRLGVLVVAVSVIAYWGAAVGGESPDQLAVATKLGEILALAIIVRPPLGAGVRRTLVANGAIVLLVLLTGVASWVGAFGAAGANGVHVHADGAVTPGTVLPAVASRAPTEAERRAAEQLVLATRDAIEKYRDLAVAAAAGYHVDGIHGVDFHATNPVYETDGRVFDPERPETLVYAATDDGRPILLGAMFQMPDLATSGPTIGGPLTVWHGHEQICFGLLPISLTGVLSPFGMCPIGSIDVPRTPQMIHVWIVPNAPEAIGDLDEAWRREYVRAQ